jgi:hypothetical protein
VYDVLVGEVVQSLGELEEYGECFSLTELLLLLDQLVEVPLRTILKYDVDVVPILEMLHKTEDVLMTQPAMEAQFLLDVLIGIELAYFLLANLYFIFYSIV